MAIENQEYSINQDIEKRNVKTRLMRVISWAKAFVVVGRGSSYLFVSLIQNQEFAASLEGGILGE